MTYIWKNTYNQSMGEYFSKTMKKIEHIDTFYMLWKAFKLEYFIKSAFFQSLRVGDEKYELWVYKSKSDEYVMVKFIVS